jgi:miniconductance mechanosensitive channel
MDASEGSADRKAQDPGPGSIYQGRLLRRSRQGRALGLHFERKRKSPMDVKLVQDWIAANPVMAFGAAVLGLLVLYLVARVIFGRGLIYLTSVTRNKYDDVIVQKLHPYRAAWLIPFIALYIFAYLSPEYEAAIERLALFFILWLTALTLNGLINAANQVYESSSVFKGVSIQGYLEIVKLLVLLVAVILSISLVTGQSPLLLLSGLGALTAVLLFVFHDTIMALIASVMISVNDLVKEGDWLEVPSYEADGIVINVSLYTIRIRNWDNTITVIPTHKLVETSYRNWRGMQESGGRRIKRAVHLDQTTIRFCTPQMIERYGKIDLIADFVADRKEEIAAYRRKRGRHDSPLDGPQVTNAEIFRAYVESYLKSHPHIHTRNKSMDFLIRELAPSPTGLPVEVYVFTKTTQWTEYEHIQAQVFDHLLAAAEYFDLRVFQEPAGADFAKALGRSNGRA